MLTSSALEAGAARSRSSSSSEAARSSLTRSGGDGVREAAPAVHVGQRQACRRRRCSREASATASRPLGLPSTPTSTLLNIFGSPCRDRASISISRTAVKRHRVVADRPDSDPRTRAPTEAPGAAPAVSGPAAPDGPLSDDELRLLHAYWRAANYLSVGQIYLLDNPLLREPLRIEHIKPRLLGHWGTTPGLNFIYAHLNRVIRARDLNALYVTGPGHGGPGLVANVYLEGTYSEVYPHIGHDEEGLRRLFRQFSFPGGIPSHVAPQTPGSIHEGGELGYALVHAYGAAFDNPDLLVCCRGRRRRGRDRPARGELALEQVPRTLRATAPCCRFCTSTATRSPTRRFWRGSPPTSCARCSRATATRPASSKASDPPRMHQLMAATLDEVTRGDRGDPAARRDHRASSGRPCWPMIVLRTPKGWTGPKVVDGLPAEGSFRSHQVPLADLAAKPEHLAAARAVDSLLRARGAVRSRAGRCAPSWRPWRHRGPAADGRQPACQRRPAAARARDARLPRATPSRSPGPGASTSEATRVLGGLLREVIQPQPRELPPHGPRRDGLQPPRRRVRGHRPRVGGARRSPATTTWRATGG